MKASRSLYIGLLFFILVVSSILRFYGLDRLSLWADELWVVMDSTRGSLWEMLGWIYAHDNHPPGYYFLVRYTQFIFGSSDFAIRFPSAVAGIALVAATFVVGKKHFSMEGAIIAAALVAGSYPAIYYSQEARPNIFAALFALLAFHYFRAVMLECDRSRKNYCMFWVSAAITSYFHYTGLIFCVCLGLVYLFIIVIKRRKSDAISGLVLFVPFALMYLPWIFGIFNHLVSTPVTAWQRPPDFGTLRTTFWFLFGPDNPRLVFYQLVFIGIIATLAVFSFRFWRNKNVEQGKFALLSYTLAMIILPVLVFYIKSVVSQDAYNHRHFLYAIPLAALLAGYFLHEAIKKFPEKNQAKLFISVVLFIVVYQFAANNSRALYTANHFKQEFREGAQVVVNDASFLQQSLPEAHKGMIVSNTVFFDHYLGRLTDAQRKSDFIYDWDQKITALQSLITEQHISEFYYLEAPIVPGANHMVTAEDTALIDRYQPLCRTRFARVQVFKFSAVGSSKKVELSALPDCRKQSI